MADTTVKEGVEQGAYEVALLLRAEGDLAPVAKSFSQHSLTVVLEGPLKPLKLAYEIKKATQAFFAFFEIKGLPEHIAQLEKSLQMNPAILRSLILHSPRIAERRDRREGDAQKRPMRPKESRVAVAVGEIREEPKALSNEALEKKIEEILQ